MSADKYLQKSAELYRDRNKVYGDAYKNHGLLMEALFPNGVELKTMSDFNRFGVLNMIASKLVRYGANFATGGHDDSLEDLATYAAMLRELDEDRKGEKRLEEFLQDFTIENGVFFVGNTDKEVGFRCCRCNLPYRGTPLKKTDSGWPVCRECAKKEASHG